MTAVLSALCLALSFTACTRVSSEELRTIGIAADIRVTAYGTGTSDVSVYLHPSSIDSLTFIELMGNDKLFAAVGAVEKPLEKFSLLNIINYAETFTSVDQPGTEYTVRFNRTVDASAPRSYCNLPANLTLTSPAAGSTFSRGSDDVVVTYTGSGNASDQLRFKLSGACIDDVERTVDTGDTGTIVIDNDFFAASGSDASKTCEVTIAVQRVRPGILDLAFKGGKIECKQERTLRISSTP